MAAFSVERVGADRLVASGELGFATARQALQSGLRLIDGTPNCTIDLARITEGDSAGLAVLIEWLAAAEARGGRVRYLNVPSQMLAIARISDVDEFLAT